MKVLAKKMTDEWVPALAKLAPQSGCYMSEVSSHVYLSCMSERECYSLGFLSTKSITFAGRSVPARLETGILWFQLPKPLCN